MAEIFFEEQLIQRALFPALDNTFGVLYLGVTAAALLWGVGTSQTYWYLSRYPMDPPLWRVSVVVLWILNTTHQVMITHIVYHYLVTNYFNPAQLLVRIWSLPLQAVLQHTAALISQFFFLVQIWRLSKGRWYLVIAPILFMFSTVGVGMVWVAKVMSTKQIQVALREYGVFSEVASAGLALANISLAATIVYLLHTARTGARKSDGVLTRIMIYTINTGAVTSICSILSVATAIALPNAFFFGAFYFLAGRLYLNTMLVSLNSRQPALREKTPFVEMNIGNFEGASGAHTLDMITASTKSKETDSANDDPSPARKLEVFVTHTTRNDSV